MIRCTSVFERNMMADYPKSLPEFQSDYSFIDTPRVKWLSIE